MRTAIIVDDEPITRMDFEEILTDAGFNVIAQGKDGFDAVELCEKHNPDLLLIDIKMPIFDGLSAAENIIKMKTAASVILVTAYSDKKFVEKAKEIGVTGYVTKPVDERSLIPIIEIAIAQTDRHNKIIKETEKMKNQLEGKSLIDRAKMIVAKREGIFEGEAYSKIQKMSMDKRIAMVDMAKIIVDTYSNDITNTTKKHNKKEK